MANILVIRFSAIGDVAMTVPILYSLARQYPNDNITLLSRAFLKPLLGEKHPPNLHFMSANLKDKHKGIKGLNLLIRELKDLKFDYVADIHDVLRSKYIRTMLKISGVKIAAIDKGRKEKKQLTRQKNKRKYQLLETYKRYIEVFNKLGFSINPDFISLYNNEKGNLSSITFPLPPRTNKWIGIAPFAKHRGKIYPIDSMEQVVKDLSKEDNLTIFLFGGGDDEKFVMEDWEAKYNNVISLAGKTKFAQELSIISHLSVMLSMDSANMHLASLVNTRVISIWGATHYYAGFMGWGQSIEDAIEADMHCRPCSVYGNKPCYKKDYPCMNISPQRIVSKIMSSLN